LVLLLLLPALLLLLLFLLVLRPVPVAALGPTSAAALMQWRQRFDSSWSISSHTSSFSAFRPQGAWCSPDASGFGRRRRVASATGRRRPAISIEQPTETPTGVCPSRTLQRLFSARGVRSACSPANRHRGAGFGRLRGWNQRRGPLPHSPRSCWSLPAVCVRSGRGLRCRGERRRPDPRTGRGSGSRAQRVAPAVRRPAGRVGCRSRARARAARRTVASHGCDIEHGPLPADVRREPVLGRSPACRGAQERVVRRHATWVVDAWGAESADYSPSAHCARIVSAATTPRSYGRRPRKSAAAWPCVRRSARSGSATTARRGTSGPAIARPRLTRGVAPGTGPVGSPPPPSASPGTGRSLFDLAREARCPADELVLVDAEHDLAEDRQRRAPPVSLRPSGRLSSKPIRTATVILVSVSGSHEERISEVARRPGFAHHRHGKPPPSRLWAVPSGRRTTPRSPSWIAWSAPVRTVRTLRGSSYSLSPVALVTRSMTCGSARTPDAMARYASASSSRRTSDAPSAVGQVGLQRGPDPHLVRGSDHRVHADLPRDPHGRGVARFSQGLARRDGTLELIVVVGDLLGASGTSSGTSIGSSGTVVSRSRPDSKAARYTSGFIAEPGWRNEPVTRL